MMIGAVRLLGRLRTAGHILAAGVLLAAAPAVAGEFPLMPGESVIGNLQEYVTKQGDNLINLSRRFDIGYTEMLAANPGVDPWIPGVGKRLTIPSLFIIPEAPRRGIVINLAERRLYYFPPGQNKVETYPIGIGVIGRNTPLGTTRVVRKEPNPVWIPPPSIRAERPELPAVIGPGPDNPLGAYALRLGWKNYLIHGTDKPPGVGRNVSHGCIHLYPEDIEALFNMVNVGTPVRVVSQPAAAAWIGIGLYVETHPNKEQADQIDMDEKVVRTPVDGLREIVQAAAGQYADAVNWPAVDQAGLERTGLPVLVAQRPPQPLATARPPATDRGASPLEADDSGTASVGDDEGPMRPSAATDEAADSGYGSSAGAVGDDPIVSPGDDGSATDRGDDVSTQDEYDSADDPDRGAEDRGLR